MTEKTYGLIRGLTTDDDKSEVEETLLKVADSLITSGASEGMVFFNLQDIVRVMRNNYGD